MKVLKTEAELRQFAELLAVKSGVQESSLEIRPLTDLSTELLQKDLNLMLNLIGNDIWMHLDIMGFFEEMSTQSVLTRMHMIYLTKQVRLTPPRPY